MNELLAPPQYGDVAGNNRFDATAVANDAVRDWLPEPESFDAND